MRFGNRSLDRRSRANVEVRFTVGRDIVVASIVLLHFDRQKPLPRNRRAAEKMVREGLAAYGLYITIKAWDAPDDVVQLVAAHVDRLFPELREPVTS